MSKNRKNTNENRSHQDQRYWIDLDENGEWGVEGMNEEISMPCGGTYVCKCGFGEAGERRATIIADCLNTYKPFNNAECLSVLEGIGRDA